MKTVTKATDVPTLKSRKIIISRHVFDEQSILNATLNQKKIGIKRVSDTSWLKEVGIYGENTHRTNSAVLMVEVGEKDSIQIQSQLNGQHVIQHVVQFLHQAGQKRGAFQVHQDEQGEGQVSHHGGQEQGCVQSDQDHVQTNSNDSQGVMTNPVLKQYYWKRLRVDKGDKNKQQGKGDQQAVDRYQDVEVYET